MGLIITDARARLERSEPEVSEDRALDDALTSESSTPSTRLTQASQIALVVLGTLAALGLAYFARAVFLPVLAAAVISIALKPPMRWLRKCHVAVGVAGALLAVPILTTFKALCARVPALSSVDDFLSK